MRSNATMRKLGTAGVFLLLIGGLWVGLSLLPERAPGERKQIADLLDQGEGSEARGRLGDAQAAYRNALSIAEKVADAKAQIAARIALARLAAAHDQHTEAATDLAPALSLAQGLKDAERTATVLNNLGEIARAQGNLEEAWGRFQQTLDLAGASEKARAAALNNLGEVARAERRLAEALNYYRQSQAVNEKLDYKPGLAANLANIGAVHLAQGNPREAVRWLERGYRMAFESADRLTLPAILTTLGQAQVAAGNPEEGGASLIEARDQYLLMGLEGKAAALTREIERLRQAIHAPASAVPARPGEPHPH